MSFFYSKQEKPVSFNKSGNDSMPRGARLDAPGELHYVIIRGIEKEIIVRDDEGRKEFLRHTGEMAQAG